MQLTNNDKMFLEQVQRYHEGMRQANHIPQALKIAKSSLSPELLSIFGIESNSLGFWCFNQYVEFEPLFKSELAKDWQIVENVR